MPVIIIPPPQFISRNAPTAPNPAKPAPEIHPLFRTFCLAAHASDKIAPRQCACPILLLLLPLVFLVVAAATGSLFDTDAHGNIFRRCLNLLNSFGANFSAHLGTVLPIAAATLLLLCGLVYIRSTARHRAHSH